MFFSNIISSVIFSTHSFNCEVIMYSAELYSYTDLKSCSLRASIHYKQLEKLLTLMTIFFVQITLEDI